MRRPKLRGRLVGTFQINIVVGILLAYLSNYLIGTLHMGLHEWRWELGVSAVPAILFFIMLFSIPDSSRWLVSKSRNSEALDVLKLTGAPDSEAELKEIVDSLHFERATEPLFPESATCSRSCWLSLPARSTSFQASTRSSTT